MPSCHLWVIRQTESAHGAIKAVAKFLPAAVLRLSAGIDPATIARAVASMSKPIKPRSSGVFAITGKKFLASP